MTFSIGQKVKITTGRKKHLYAFHEDKYKEGKTISLIGAVGTITDIDSDDDEAPPITVKLDIEDLPARMSYEDLYPNELEVIE